MKDSKEIFIGKLQTLQKQNLDPSWVGAKIPTGLTEATFWSISVLKSETERYS